MLIQQLFDVILERQGNPKADSYTNRLLAMGEDEILKKIGEESVEVILAAKGQGNERLISEMADRVISLSDGKIADVRQNATRVQASELIW